MSVPHALLALLAEEPKFGLRLKEEFEQRTGSVRPLNVGQVYSTLQRLERDGLVANSGEAGTVASQKLYSLTGEGAAELRSWLSTPPADPNPSRDEVVIKIMIALAVPGIDVLEVVQDHRRQALESMQTLTRLKVTGDDLAMVLVVDSLLFRHEATIRWLDTCEARFRSGDFPLIPSSGPSSGTAQARKQVSNDGLGDAGRREGVSRR